MKAALLAVLLLSGCSTLDRMLENRIVCSLDRQQAAVISWWGGWGASAKIAAADAEIACAERAILIKMGPST